MQSSTRPRTMQSETWQVGGQSTNNTRICGIVNACPWNWLPTNVAQLLIWHVLQDPLINYVTDLIINKKKCDKTEYLLKLLQI